MHFLCVLVLCSSIMNLQTMKLAKLQCHKILLLLFVCLAAGRDLSLQASTISSDGCFL